MDVSNIDNFGEHVYVKDKRFSLFCVYFKLKLLNFLKISYKFIKGTLMQISKSQYMLLFI